jgi:hypothetical protein
MRYMPTMRGFCVGVALWTAVASVGCFDTGRIHLAPDGTEVVTKDPNLAHVPKDGDKDFVGPPRSFADRRAAADADGDRIAAQWTGWLLTLLVVGSVIALVASLVFQAASIRVALIGFAGAVVVTVFRSTLLAYGPWMRDGLVICGIFYGLYTVWHYFYMHRKIKAGKIEPSPVPLANFWSRVQALFSKPEVKP